MARKEIDYNGNSFAIAYEIINPSQPRDILFLHGWGSNKEIMQSAFGKVLPGFRQIYIDLPGFGKSESPTALTTADYAGIVETFLDAIGAKKEVIAGHSFGGKVATLLQPQLLVLLSSAGIVTPKPLSIRLKIALFKLLKPLGGGSLRKWFAAKDVSGMPPHMYQTFKNVVDEDFSGVFGKYPGRALLFWGISDTATPLQSAEKIASLIPDSQLIPMEGDHYFFTRHAREIAAKIEKERDGTV